jgi:hypothetical protein
MWHILRMMADEIFNRKAISNALLNTLELISHYNAAAYCKPQQSGNIGGKVNCGSSQVCSLAQDSDTKIYNEFEK